MDVTLVCFAALVAATPGQVGSAAGPSGAIGGWQVSGMADAETPPLLWKPAANFDEVVIRAQNGSPFYEELGPADGGGEYDRCDGDHLAATDTAMPAGTYTAWPFARVTVDTVTHPDGSADAAPEGDRIVVGFPTQVTFTD